MKHSIENALWFKNSKVHYIDQRFLPSELEIVVTADWQVIAQAIRDLAIRGAPLIGIAAAYGVVLSAMHFRESFDLRKNVTDAIETLAGTRPTAVNLFYALDKMKSVLNEVSPDEDIVSALLEKAVSIHNADIDSCEAIAEHGLKLIPDNARVLTICNTGILATGGIGTALGIIYKANELGKIKEVYACETRPLMQGARLTYTELISKGIKTYLIADSMGSTAMQQNKVDVCIIGADRIAKNGDTANKIGSYQLAIAAQRHGIPFIVAAPQSTFDAKCEKNTDIPIEVRAHSEFTQYLNNSFKTEFNTWNPAFDVIPADLITFFVTESGVYHKPYKF